MRRRVRAPRATGEGRPDGHFVPDGLKNCQTGLITPVVREANIRSSVFGPEHSEEK